MELNIVVGSNAVKFTGVLWDAKYDIGEAKVDYAGYVDLGGGISVATASSFPFLEMKMEWNEEGRLEFAVYSKPKQQIKYLHKYSNHTNSCKKEIPKGFFGHLAKITTSTHLNHNSRLDKLYPAHAAALKKAGLAPPKFPILY